MKREMFVNRHLGPDENQIKKILSKIGLKSIENLLDETIPDSIRLKKPLDLPEGISEAEFTKHINSLGRDNKVFKTYIGLGYHDTVTPAVIQRNILENPSWYTAYTPYQAEIAQGRLEALFNFQTIICELTGMELANASLLDESTAAAEAMTMLFGSQTKEQKKHEAFKFFVDENVLPQTLSVLKTRSAPLGINLVVGDANKFEYDSTFFGSLFQYPGAKGEIPNLKSWINNAKDNHVCSVVAADIMSLVMLESPGTFGADVVVGTTQRFGIPMGYGGPHAAFFATRDKYKRNIPGRIIGKTKDLNENPALRMALQTREQHIKRDRATSNICTAQVLLAVMAGMYVVYHGPKGLYNISNSIHQKAVDLNLKLSELGFKQINKHFFDTLQIKTNVVNIKKKAELNKVNFYYPDGNTICISLNEAVTDKDIDKIVSIFKSSSNSIKKISELKTEESYIPKSLIKSGEILTHKIFNSYHSETALMRYIKYLERKDLALNHSMISLGSCTMKLNAAAEMLPLSDSNWGSIHPFVPSDQVIGYQKMLNELKLQLTKITGFADTSLQPNSGAQGEYAGLMVIRAYHENQNQKKRNICLIPASAHGTNPASAVMAGMEVVVINTDSKGNIDWNDINEKAQIHKDSLAALMITYPSTHGVFETRIKDITQLIHDCGGQVYMDGANMNAQVGLTSPAQIGADVCHLNLHKTFAIPHGGGGPGVGPISVASHLKPFLPGNPVVKTGGLNAITSISGAPYGSALACLISYGYIKMLGGDGLRKATEVAILNANYIQKRLDGAYDILYSGEKGRSAHELIIDCRPFKNKGIEVVDIAKRLMDYGFHAPTVSFPVAGTMMIEPTESENLEEIDRFCDAMISIRMEIASDNENDTAILKNAPHTLEMVTSDVWEFPYSRQKAAFPLEFVSKNKFWPSVRRVDEAYGDRNLVCTCDPIESYIGVSLSDI